MTQAIHKLTKKVSKDIIVMKTGTLISYGGGVATVEIEGGNVTLPMMDSIPATVPLGTAVICAVHGRTGIVIGTLNTTTRTNSDIYVGVGNPPPPTPSKTRYTTYSPKATGVWNNINHTWSKNPSKVRQGDDYTTKTVNGNKTTTHTGSYTGAWFYGSTSRFLDLETRTIESIEIFIGALATKSDAYPFHFYTHESASIPSSALSLDNGPVSRQASGWVSLPIEYAESLIQNGGGIAIKGTPNASLLTKTPYGTIRIGWSL